MRITLKLRNEVRGDTIVKTQGFQPEAESINLSLGKIVLDRE